MSSRADNRDGSCREILTGKLAGKWRVQYTHVTDAGKVSRLSRVFPTKTLAKQFLQELRQGAKVETAQRSRELTLDAWFTWLLEHNWNRTVAAVTAEQRRRRFAKYVKAHLGGVPLRRIDPMQVDAFYDMLRAEGVSDHLLLSIRSDLVRAYNQAITPYGRVSASSANPFRLPLPTPAPREAVALTPDEVRNALAVKALDPSRKAQLALFLLAGVRLGEMMAMTRGQLRFEEDLIVIDRAVQVAFGGKQTVGLPKKHKTRNAVMCPTLKRLLLVHAEGKTPEQYLWPAATENIPRMKKLVYATWRTIVRDAELPPGMSPHDCRLSHINAIEKLMPEVSPTTLKEHIGHAATGVTEANYTRPLTASQTILRDALERVLGLTGPKIG